MGAGGLLRCLGAVCAGGLGALGEPMELMIKMAILGASLSFMLGMVAGAYLAGGKK